MKFVNKKNEKLMGVLAVLIIILSAIYVVSYFSYKESTEDSTAMTAGDEFVQEETVTGAKTTNISVKTLSYNQALKIYGNDRRIQFDKSCQATPNNVTYKNGTQIMIDNRANTARAIKLDTIVHNISAYGFTIVTLSYSNSQLPRKMLVDCGKYQNVATLLVQK